MADSKKNLRCPPLLLIRTTWISGATVDGEVAWIQYNLKSRPFPEGFVYLPFGIHYFRPFVLLSLFMIDKMSHSAFITFDLLCFCHYLPFDGLSLAPVVTFDLLSFRFIYHSKYCPFDIFYYLMFFRSTFRPTQCFVQWCFLTSTFYTLAFCPWIPVPLSLLAL